MRTTLIGRPTTILEESWLLQGFESLMLHHLYTILSFGEMVD